MSQLNRPSPNIPYNELRLRMRDAVTEDALHVFATRLGIAALVIVGAESGDSVITAYYKQLHRPAYPTRHFTTVSDAQDWLASCFRR